MKPYLIGDSYKILDVDVSLKRYILSIRDIPDEEKPREKMLKFGADSLSVQELLAIILNTGTKKEDVLTMSGRILKEYGEQTLARKIDPKKLSKDLNIPIIKALQIAACSELGKRFFEKKNNGSQPVLRTSKDVFEYLTDIRDLPKENLRGLYLNSHYKLIYDEVISIGTIDASIIHPREVFRPAIECGAVAVILAHNHPSGNVKPSEADIAITKQLIEASKIVGIKLLDHVIISNNKFISVNVCY